jgi:hypothetical protein
MAKSGVRVPKFIFVQNQEVIDIEDTVGGYDNAS